MLSDLVVCDAEVAVFRERLMHRFVWTRFVVEYIVTASHNGI